MRRTLTVLGAMALGLLTVETGFALGMRARAPWLLNAVRRVNRGFTNRARCGRRAPPGAYASVMRHTGRTSGRAYATPVGAVATEDGFVIVLASGAATIVHEGEAYAVERPEVVPIEAVASYLPAGDLSNHRLFRVDQCLRVRRAPGPG